MSDTPRLSLPLLAASQAQKHVTHNEALLALDVWTQASVLSRALASPPVAEEGAAYLVGDAATGDWAGGDGQIAQWRDGLWHFFAPFEGARLHVVEEALSLTYAGGAWGLSHDLVANNHRLARSPHGAETRQVILETDVTGLTGAFVDTAAVIPDRAIVFCVSSRTTAAITGAASYDVGLSGEEAKFGGSLGIGEGATNLGVVGPTAFYAPTSLRLTANDGAFTGGAVRLAVHCLLPGAPLG